MVSRIVPPKLKSGDEVGVIAPSRSMAMISGSVREIANQRFRKLGLQLSFGTHVEESDAFASTSIDSRIADLHAAFEDPNIQGILTVIGGFNSNQLLRQLDWELIRNNPKVFCGFSDITALGNAIFTKTGLVTYSGPHYSTFGQQHHFDYTLAGFQQCLMRSEPFMVNPSSNWSDDEWYLDQDNRKLIPNDGVIVIHEGEATGTLLGGNLCTLNLLQGTEYMPDLNDTVLFIEDDLESNPHEFDRDLQSLIHHKGFDGVRGIVIGRFQQSSEVSTELLTQIIRTKQELTGIPVIADVDFGHTDPKITFPIGGTASLSAKNDSATIEIIVH